MPSEKNISFLINTQFPSIYREEQSEIIAFLENYYEFLETQSNQSLYNIRRFEDYKDIDTATSNFLLQLKKQYTNDLPFSDEDSKFIIKNIQDLYRRKGTPESLKLFFRLFFGEDAELFYPAAHILRPSDSIYGSDSFLEMNAVTGYENYPILPGDRITGDATLAEAYAENVVFKNYNGVIVPIISLSNVVGRFSSDDSLLVEGYRENSLGVSELTTFRTGRIIHGSISTIDINPEGRAVGYSVGDVLDIRSSKLGIQGQCTVTEVTEALTRQIIFSIQDGGYGYTTNNQLEEILISDQVLVVEEPNEVPEIQLLDTVVASNSEVVLIDPASNTDLANTYIDGSGLILGYEHPLVFVKAGANNAFNSIPFGGKASFSIQGSNTSFFVSNVSDRNDSAFFEIESIKDSETVTIITDIIEDFLNVSLNSSDYGMSGSGAETLSTTLRDAFQPVTLTIGEISSIIYDVGSNYRNDVKSIVRQPFISKFKKKNLVMRFETVDFLLQAGDVITQEIQIEDLTYQANTVPYTARAEFIRREGDDFYFKQKSFYDFDEDLPVNIRNRQYNLLFIEEDDSSFQMGLNARIRGEASFVSGQIVSVDVSSSGVLYEDGETVELVDSQGNVAATAILAVNDQGTLTAGWRTENSFLNNPSSVIRDNLYYQEYSYDVSSIIDPSRYEKLLERFVAVAGTKLFSSALINSDNDFSINIDPAVEIWNYYTANTELEQNTSVVVTEEGDLVLTEIIEPSNTVIDLI